MIEYSNSRPARIVGPNTSVLTRDMLPPAGTTRWVAKRKAEVVAAVESGMISLDEVMERYALSLEEFCSWQRAMARAGVEGLKAGSVRMHRDSHHRAESRQLSGGANAPRLELVH